MNTRYGRWLALAAVAGAVTASPAAAATGPDNAADRYGPAPGGDSFAVVSGRPHVAFVRSGGVRVAQLAGFDKTWRTVGGLVRHSAGAKVSDPYLTGGPDGHPWLAWVETVQSKWWDPQVRVATFAHGRWHEIGRGERPITSVTEGGFVPTERDSLLPARPSLAFYRGLPVVAFPLYDGNGVIPRVAQMRPGGRSWRGLPIPRPLFDAPNARIVVAGGRLYGAGTCCFSTNFHDPVAARLNSAGTSWDDISKIDPNPPDDPASAGSVDAVGKVNGLFAVLWGHRRPGPSLLNVSSLTGNAWSEIDPPLATPNAPVTGLAVASDHAVAYAAYNSTAASTPGVFVRRLIRGEWEELRTPTEGGFRGVSAQFAPARGRGMWLLSGERANGRTRYILDGYSVVSPPQLPPGQTPVGAAPRPRTVHWWDSGSSVHLTRGQGLVVDLDRSNSGSTGYHWEHGRAPARSVLRFASSHVISGGQRITYRAVGSGRTTFVLKYVPPGRGRRAVETFRLTVRVG